MIYLVMGILGSGKSSVGEALALKLDIGFHDGDDYHPERNREKMANGIPLTDEDRKPWLSAVKGMIDGEIARKRDAVVACSALKKKYRDILGVERPEIKLIYLKGDKDVICERVKERKGHFVNPLLIQSQFDILEEPENALIVNINRPVGEVVNAIINDK